MKRLIGSILAGLLLSVLLSAVIPGICLISYLSMSWSGGFAQQDCVDLFWPTFVVIFPGMLALQLTGRIFKIEWISKIDIFRFFDR